MSSSPYAPAAKVLNQMWTQGKGLKTVVYSSQGELTCSKATFAQCSHVLQHKAVLDELVKAVESKIQAKNEGLLYVLMYELMMGPNRAIRGGGALKRQLVQLQDVLRQKLDEISKERKEDALASNRDNDVDHLKPRTTIPRYVRINTLRADRTSVIKQLEAKTKVYGDPHVPDLLVLEPTPESRELLQDLVASHQVVLQDKSSCFSALCLILGFDGSDDDDDESDENDNHGATRSFDYLDACAAPGNKTSHLAALVHDKHSNVQGGSPSIIYALDRSPDRCKMLRRRMNELTVEDETINVQCHNLDFLQQKQSSGDSSSGQTEIVEHGRHNKTADRSLDKFGNVRAILLDPSCSGSGMTNNHTETPVSTDPHYSNDRIQSLSDFQFLALKHALTAFPRVDRVVYSTCSLYLKENEGVVARVLNALDRNNEEASEPSWKLVAPKCLEGWHRRGVVPVPVDDETSPTLTLEQAECCIRVDPHLDATNGFFVACLQRCGQQSQKHQQKNKNRKGNKVSLLKERRKWTPPSDRNDGLELYDNQFDTSKEATDALSGTDKSTPSPTTPRPHTASNENSQEATKKALRPSVRKRKADQSHASAPSTTLESSNEKASKKRAKKLEWKAMQRLKKDARLKLKSAS